MLDFHVIPGPAIKTILGENPALCIESAQSAYLAHHDGQTINPDSYFLRFPKNERNRIIALPASIDGDAGVSGIKWIGSFPDNIKTGLPRASALLVLNDQITGYPFACLEGALISAARTAASAVLGATWLNDRRKTADSIAFVGAGVISRNIFDMFIADGWKFERVVIHDLDVESARLFGEHAAKDSGCIVSCNDGLERALGADIVVFATNAGTPYVKPPSAFSAGQIVLNISLRDIAPELIVGAVNIFDDVDHCMKANTSPHLAEKMTGGRSFVTGTLAALIRGEISIDRTKPLIFSPFGMGILDLALGKRIYDEARKRDMTVPVPNFFAETSRW